LRIYFKAGGVPIGGVPIGGVPIGAVPIGGVPEEEDAEGVFEFECVGK
jgi:uncharacterized protein (UPF0303 family)